MNPTAGEVEQARRRCAALRHRILHSVPSSKISPSCRQTLLRLLDAELRFLSRLPPPALANPNVGYLDALVRVIHHPAVLQVSRLCKPIPSTTSIPAAHVDVVCTLGRSPSWILVSDRNPAHISWPAPHRGLRARLDRVLAVARSTALALRPATLLLVFSSGVTADVACKLTEDFGAAEIKDFFDDRYVFDELPDGWVGVSPVFESARVFKIRIVEDYSERVPVPGVFEERNVVGLRGDAFGSLVSSMGARDDEDADGINFDTTALVAMVSGISNGATEQLLKAPEFEMRRRFKGNYEFVMAQVMSELDHPIIAEMEIVIAGKKGIICESVCSEFKELVLMYGGPNEKWRAEQLVKHLLAVSDSPSARVMNLPITRKIALKNKVVFGTGDYWHAPTLTANMGFVRAISQTGRQSLHFNCHDDLHFIWESPWLRLSTI